MMHIIRINKNFLLPDKWSEEEGLMLFNIVAFWIAWQDYLMTTLTHVNVNDWRVQHASVVAKTELFTTFARSEKKHRFWRKPQIKETIWTIIKSQTKPRWWLGITRIDAFLLRLTTLKMMASRKREVATIVVAKTKKEKILLYSLGHAAFFCTWDKLIRDREISPPFQQDDIHKHSTSVNHNRSHHNRTTSLRNFLRTFLRQIPFLLIILGKTYHQDDFFEDAFVVH